MRFLACSRFLIIQKDDQYFLRNTAIKKQCFIDYFEEIINQESHQLKKTEHNKRHQNYRTTYQKLKKTGQNFRLSGFYIAEVIIAN